MNTDDPKFTAHLLGEFEDLTPAERAEIEALLASDPAAAAEASETRALAARLRAELPGEEAAALREEQRVVVRGAAEESAAKRKVVRFPRRTLAWTAIAACLVVGISAALIYRAMELEQRAVRASLAANKAPTQGDITLSVEEESVHPPDLQLLTPPSPHSQLAPGLKDVPPVPKSALIASHGTAAGAVPSFTFQAPVGTPQPASIRNPAPVAQTLASNVVASSVTKGLVSGGGKGGAARLANAPVSAISGDLGVTFVTEYISRHAPPVDASQGRNSVSADPNSPEASAYDTTTENDFLAVRENPLSTFSIDVDTASYAIVRRFLNDGQLPPKGAVRIEELLNYFSYDYPQPKGDAPFSATMEVAACPWATEHRLVRIGLKGREIAKDQRPPSNLIFLIDVSGSMNMPNKLPLLKQSFGLLIDQLGPQDQVGIVVYAGNTGCVLEPTHDKQKMREALRQLEAGGSTNGASGIQLAYQLAEQNFLKGGTNRVILATDGDWNVGVTNQSELLDMIAHKAKSGVFLTVLGFGMDNLKDSMLVKLADRGNGHYAYIDTLIEARKVFVEQLSSTLVTIAKDVKIQVEFNPAKVAAYRLIGYEKRLLAKEDFNDDKKDAGEIGAGHTVTALYEVVPAGQEWPPLAKVDALKYQPNLAPKTRVVLPPPGDADAPANPEPKAIHVDKPKADANAEETPRASAATLIPEISNEMLTLKLRYKAPDGDTSKLVEFPLIDAETAWEKSSRDFRFAAAVAGYGMLLRDSAYKGQTTWNTVAEWAHEGLGNDASGYRAEFLSLLEKAQALSR